MDFIKIPYDGLLSKDYAAGRRTLIDPQRASLEMRPGDPSKFMKSTAANPPVSFTSDGDADHIGDTSYLAVVDKDRNMVSFEPSLHSAWGTGVVMADLGFILNCRGDYYSLVAAQRCRLRDERATGDRGTAVVNAQFPGLAVPAHDVSGRSVD